MQQIQLLLLLLLLPIQPILQVSAYHLTSYSVTPSATNFNGAGWASNMGAAKDAGALHGERLSYA
jgi:hypothetical protein